MFTYEIKTINAKEWKPTVCDVSVEESFDCNNVRCRFSAEGECCVEFQFCDDCLNNKRIPEKIFVGYANMMG